MSEASIESAGRPDPSEGWQGQRTILLSRPYFDSHDVVCGDTEVSSVGLVEKFSMGDWNGVPITFALSRRAPGGLISMGFYEHEDFGAWSRVADPWLVLPFAIKGTIAIALWVRGYGASVGSIVTMTIGGCVRHFTLGLEDDLVTLIFDDVAPTSEIHFSGLSTEHDRDADDPRTMGLGLTSVSLRQIDGGRHSWNGEKCSLRVATDDSHRLWTAGTYYLETWGAWSREETISLVLPFSIRGRVTVTFDIVGWGPTVGRHVTVCIGSSERLFELHGGESSVTLTFVVDRPTAAITMSGLIAQSVPGQADQRTIAVGLKGVSLVQKRRVAARLRDSLSRWRSPRSAPTRARREQTQSIQIDGLLYLAVLSPETVERRDWIEMMTAFCWVFRKDPDATLVIQVPDTSFTAIISAVMVQLHRIGDMECSILLTTPVQAGAVHMSLASRASFSVLSHGGDPDRATLDRCLSSGTPTIASITEEEARTYDGVVIAAPPLRRPTRVDGHRFKVTTELRNEPSWEAFARAFERTRSIANDTPEAYAELRRAATERGERQR